MPYRRLPNTDKARIRALRAALDKHNSQFGNNVITLDVSKTEVMLRNFENAQIGYKNSLDTQASANRKFQKLVKNAKLYISHFIQVLNLCVIRNEIKKDAKKLYGLDPDNNTVPDLTNNDSMLYWGDSVIKGEQARLSQGGVPIYNPAIARVNVAYPQFKDAYVAQKTYQNSTIRQLEVLSQQRSDIDKLLTDIWNQVETVYSQLPQQERLSRCREFGIVYYLRKEEQQRENN